MDDLGKLIVWFEANFERIPWVHFDLSAGERVSDPRRFLEMLATDVRILRRRLQAVKAMAEREGMS